VRNGCTVALGVGDSRNNYSITIIFAIRGFLFTDVITGVFKKFVYFLANSAQIL
jgi:hypothetical protein